MRAHVAPEERVQYVSGKMKGQVLLQLVDGREIALLPSLGELLKGRVRARNVGGVVLVMVQLEQPRRIVRFERRVVIGQVGERILFIHR